MQEQNNEEITFNIQRIYIKDLSFEAPNVPKIFQQEWQPKIKLDLDTKSIKLSLYIYEVVLRVHVTVMINDYVAFLCEVHQAGIFTISGIEDTKINHCLGVYCPEILFPYARECITNQVSRGTFPQFNLAPVNFDLLFKNYLKQNKHT